VRANDVDPGGVGRRTYASCSVSKRTVSPGLGSLGTGAMTAVALAVQTGLAAVVGVIVARDFGRSATTDGFFAAYSVFVVVLLAANAIRVVVLPSLARAREERRLGAEVAAYALTLATFALPVLVVGVAAARQLSWLLTGNGVDAARESATGVLPWMLAAAVLQLFAGLAASTLAALDDYATSAAGFVLGSVAGLVFILAEVHSHGIVAIAWGMSVNGAIALFVPLCVLALRARSANMPVAAVQPTGIAFRARLAEMGTGISVALVLQAIYLVCVPLAGREGTGAVTSFGYAYLVASAVVAVTGSSLGLVTSVPLTRTALDTAKIVRHIVSSSWLAVVAIGAAAGIFGLAGQQIVRGLFGSSYGAKVGTELGRLVVLFSPWAIASVGISLTFPLVFVARRERRLPLLALGGFVVHVPIAVIGGLIAGLDGLAVALAITTVLILAGLLSRLDAMAPTLRGLASAALTVVAGTCVAFVPPRLFLEPVVAAVVGTVLYGLLVALVRPPALRAAWRYLRVLS
jgi:hypothetical protein